MMFDNWLQPSCPHKDQNTERCVNGVIFRINSQFSAGFGIQESRNEDQIFQQKGCAGMAGHPSQVLVQQIREKATCLRLA